MSAVDKLTPTPTQRHKNSPPPDDQAASGHVAIPKEPIYRRWLTEFGLHAQGLPKQDEPAGGPHCAEGIRDSIPRQPRPLFPTSRGDTPGRRPDRGTNRSRPRTGPAPPLLAVVGSRGTDAPRRRSVHKNTPLPGHQAVLPRFVIPQEPVYRRWPAKFGLHARVLPRTGRTSGRTALRRGDPGVIAI